MTAGKILQLFSMNLNTTFFYANYRKQSAEQILYYYIHI